jgi:hypothetical protein
MAGDAPASLARRLGWLALLWCGGVAAVAAVALLIRLAMRAAGMSS